MKPAVRFLGLDPPTSGNKASSFAVINEGLEVVSQGYIYQNEEVMAQARRWSAGLVAIDAPLFLPLGLDCLEEGCPCSQTNPRKGRVCEQELRARWGISSYYTTKRSPLKPMVYRAMRLKKELSSRGHQVIEVYPHATAVRLWGRPIPRKTTPEGLRFLEERLRALLPGWQPGPVWNHDVADALLAAYTAYLYREGRAEAVGTADEGLLIIPRAEVR